MKISLPNYVKLVLDKLKTKGKAYVVGGALRDLLLHGKSHDYDIATSLVPSEVSLLFKEYKQINNLGIKHGTVSVVVLKEVVEITTFRCDLEYVDGRHPTKVLFTDDLSLDLKRRDFTINALAYNEEEGLIDLVGGLTDLNNKVIRTVGKPLLRFKEDYLRILRGLRFSSKLGFKIEDNTYEAMKLLALNVNKYIAKERINKEFCGLLLGNYLKDVLILYKDVACIIFPYLANVDISKIDILPIDLELRLAYILANTSNYKDVLTDLRFSNKTINNVCFYLKYLNFDLDSNLYQYKLLLQEGKNKDLVYNLFKLISIMKNKDISESLLIIDNIINNGDALNIKDLAINGNDLLKLNLSGKRIKKVLNKLLELVLKEELINNREELLKKALEL